ncbi:putative receptor protein kinase ZmPK1 [Camellia lanceoleosa]|uniref:Receptor protein kinase ZmPK1 n=1 Tax=Camellia lanceoleosa TaxID=1840588 RepID=A0ACC0HSE8_9ERIC|nr:putative receptor protein kinase ZmPK1 [Camellia lanceoleosa]
MVQKFLAFTGLTPAHVFDSGRTIFNSSKIAILDTSGYFVSSDFLKFKSADLGLGIQRRLTLDFDGNLRLYSLDEKTGNWTVTWQAMADPCRVHGLCGPNSICSYGSGSGRGCSCLPGHKIKNQSDWSYGCEFEYNLPDDDRKASFVSVDHMRSYGYDYQSYGNSTLESCKEFCLHTLICKGFVFIFESGVYRCNFKSQLRNGRHSPNVIGTLYVKLNVSKKSNVSSSNAVPVKEMKLNCSSLGKNTIQLDRVYKTNDGNKFLNFLVWFACAIGVVEMLCILLISFLVFKKPNNSGPEMQGYFLAATKFKRFTYAEMKRATRGFSEEIGRGGHGVVYKGILPDHRIAAIKRLNEANEGEAEFLAEASTIGRKMNGSEALWIEEIIDPVMMGGCERSKMENLVRVAVQCVEADTDARPTMREVVEMLLGHEDSHDTA